MPLNGGQFDSLGFNQKLNAMVQNMRQISESQMKEAKQFLDKAQESIMTSFYKENQSFMDRVIAAQNNMRNGIANSDDKVIVRGQECFAILGSFGSIWG